MAKFLLKRMVFIGVLFAAAACGEPSKGDILEKAKGITAKTELAKALGKPDDINKLGPSRRGHTKRPTARSCSLSRAKRSPCKPPAAHSRSIVLRSGMSRTTVRGPGRPGGRRWMPHSVDRAWRASRASPRRVEERPGAPRPEFGMRQRRSVGSGVPSKAERRCDKAIAKVFIT